MEKQLSFWYENKKEFEYELLESEIKYFPDKKLVKVPFLVTTSKKVKILFIFYVDLNKNKFTVKKDIISTGGIGLRVFQSEASEYEHSEIPQVYYEKIKKRALAIANKYKKKPPPKEQLSLPFESK